MGSHIGGGEESWIWQRSRCHPSRKWVARVHHVLVFCLLLAAKFDAAYINISTNICLLSATDVMEHIAFPGNKDFAADYNAHSCIIHEGLLCLFIVCETMLAIHKSRTISNANDTQAQQVAPNPRRGRFSTEILSLSSGARTPTWNSTRAEDGSNKQRNRKNITQWISNAKVILRANWSDSGYLAGN